MSTAKAHKSERIMAWVTPALKDHLEQVLTQRRKADATTALADVVREALRFFLDHEAEVMGSKAHQVRTFQRQTDRLHRQLVQLEARLVVMENVNLHLLAILAAYVLREFQEKEHDPHKLMALALKSAVGERGLAFIDELYQVAETLRSE